jgi:hypothetical protein
MEKPFHGLGGPVLNHTAKALGLKHSQRAEKGPFPRLNYKYPKDLFMILKGQTDGGSGHKKDRTECCDSETRRPRDSHVTNDEKHLCRVARVLGKGRSGRKGEQKERQHEPYTGPFFPAMHRITSSTA